MELEIKLWVKWKDRLDDMEIRRATGVKSSGIEYRIMLEGGVTWRDRGVDMDWELIARVDQVYRKLYHHFPREMDAVVEYYRRKKSFRAVRMKLNCSQHSSKILVVRGETLIQGGYIALMDIEVD